MDNRKFGRVFHYGEPIEFNRPKVGCLKYKEGNNYQVLVENMPFTYLQMKKREYIGKGVDKKKLIITY